MVLASSTTSAVDYSAGLNMAASASHNDNIRLTEKDKTEVRKYVASPTLMFGAATETSEIKFDSTFDFNRYDRDEFNSDDQRASLSLQHQFETSSIALNTAYINNTTTTSELLTTGIIGVTAERATQYQVSPQWTYGVNEANLLQIQGSYIVQDYESDAYTGYKNIGAQADWMYKINERISWITSLTYSDYQADDLVFNVPPNSFFLPIGYFGQQSYAVRTKSKGLNIGLSYEWSEQSSVDVRLGQAKSSTAYPIKDLDNTCLNSEYLEIVSLVGEVFGAICNPLPRSDASSSTADLTWKWHNERHQASLNGTKQTQPTSNGYAVDAIQVNSSWSYRLTELDQLSMDLTLVRNRAIDNKNSLRNISNADRDYGAGTLAYQRQIGEFWFLRASYQYAKQKYTNADYEADSNVWTLSVNYRPQQWHWAR